MIELKNVDVTFGKGTLLANHVLKSINLKVQNGEFVTIIGGNGAGKSTLMNVLSGDIIPDKGIILIDNIDVTNQPTEKRASLVARVFQDPMIGSCANLTIEENLSLAFKRGQNRGLKSCINKTIREKFKDALAELEIGLENRLGDKVASLSGGQRQAVSLVMATLQPSKILLLDEHTASLDPKMARIILELTKKLVTKYQLTALMITHSMTQALEFGTRTIMMYHGEITRDMYGEERKQLNPADLLAFFDL